MGRGGAGGQHGRARARAAGGATGYAVWVGIGASLTVADAMVTGAEPVLVARLLLPAGLVGCVIGLRVLG